MQSTPRRRLDGRGRALLVTTYVVLAVFVFTEKWGQATSDTRFELTEVPAEHLAGTFRLWNPAVSLGEMQNQAYGYLFPHGSFFVLLDALGSPGWVTQRLWTLLVLLLACEGLRRVAMAVGVPPGAAVLAGLAYGLTPRHVTELGTRSAEILPAAVLPWALLPLVLAIDRRMRPRTAAVLSAAAFACSGGVNGTATAAPAALLLVVVLWAVWRRHLTWRFAAGWLALVGAVSAWWILSLLRLGAYSPPFYDYVEDSRATTSTSAFGPVLRGASNWVGYITVDGKRWWPAGYDLAYEPWLVLGSGLVAILGFLGLLRMRHSLRTPLLLAAVVGLTGQVIAHTGALDSPLAPFLRDLLDGPLAPLRNVPKLDPVLRVPLALGVGVLAGDLAAVVRRRAAPGSSWVRARGRQVAAGGLAVALAAGLVAMAQPILTADTRTPGWDEIPDYWWDAAHFIEHRAEVDDDVTSATWVIPGAGFGVEQWGWTMEEPMEAVASTPWITRSQVPLTPPATIRQLSAMEAFIETGAGSPYLRHLLNRMGIDTVLVRHDLDTEVARTTSANVVSVALGRSPGLTNIASFGQLAFGPAIEIFSVEPPVGALSGTGGYDVRDVADAVTVRGSVEAAVQAVGAGLVGPTQPMVLSGTEGWDAPPQVVGDGYRRRERAFGQVHDAESNVMTPDEPFRGDRVVPNYPGEGDSPPVVARYDGIAGVDASTSRAWANSIGTIQPENAPWSTLDGDLDTYWRPAPFTTAVGQWLEVDLGSRRSVGRITLIEPVGEFGVDRVGRWRVTAGDTSRILTTNPFTGSGSIRLGVVADRVRVEVLDAPSPQSAVGIAELEIDGVRADRTLLLPADAEAGADVRPDLVLTARQEARPCVVSFLGADCDRYRARASEESTGIDRVVTLDSPTTYRATGIVVARSRRATLDLLQPLAGPRMEASSWLGADPAISPRMAHDGSQTTAWVADPRDPAPTLTIDLGKQRVLRNLTITAPTGGAVRPDHATLQAETADGTELREVDLTGTGDFDQLRARRVTITFGRTVAVAGSPPLGIGELRLGDVPVTVPLDGAGPTGSVCGYGPPLVIDGERRTTRVDGLVGEVVAAGQLGVVPCGSDDEDLVLAAGEHRIQLLSTEQFQPVSLVLDAQGSGAQSDRATSRSRELSLISSTPTRVVLDVGPGEDALISTPHNVNAGWVATVDGRELEPVTVDGWAQGWRIPQGVQGEVDLVFAPQRGYLVGLVGGLVLLAAVLLWAVVLLAREWWLRRRRPADAEPVAAPATDHRALVRPTPRTTALLVLCAGLSGWLVGGPVVGAAAIVGVLLAPRPRLTQFVVALVLVVTLIAFVLLLVDDPVRPTRAQDLATGAALAVGIAAVLARRREPE